MSLSAALGAARSSLAVNASQTAILSRNIAGAEDALYTRKSAIITSSHGGVRVEAIGRAANGALLNTMLGATSQASGQQALVDGLKRLWPTIGDPEADLSPAALIGALRDAVQQHASAPDDPLMGHEMLTRAGDLAAALRASSETVQTARAQADADMAESVERINTLLAHFEALNTEIVRGTHKGADITAKLDARDQVVAGLAEEIGLRIVNRADNDIALYTDSGVTLFETKARSVTMVPTPLFEAGIEGQAVFVDGVPVAGGGAMQVGAGRLAGLAAFRDSAAVTYQGQVDEIARGLVELFAESDQSDPSSLPTIPGLFTYPGAPEMPATAALAPGLAATLAINPNADPEQGGDLGRLRDGGIGDPLAPGYIYNSTGASAFSGRLQELADAFGEKRAFHAPAGVEDRADLAGFAAASVGWLEASRQKAAAEIDYREALLTRSKQALSNETGVNIDEEMTALLELERSYQASAKLIATIDSMLGALLAAVR